MTAPTRASLLRQLRATSDADAAARVRLSGQVCGAAYGHNPDRCYYPAGHAGPHNNRYGCTWPNEGDA